MFNSTVINARSTIWRQKAGSQKKRRLREKDKCRKQVERLSQEKNQEKHEKSQAVSLKYVNHLVAKVLCGKQQKKVKNALPKTPQNKAKLIETVISSPLTKNILSSYQEFLQLMAFRKSYIYLRVFESH